MNIFFLRVEQMQVDAKSIKFKIEIYFFILVSYFRRNVDSLKEKTENMNLSFNAEDDYLLLDDSNATGSSRTNGTKSLMNPITMRFTDSQLEQTFHEQIDRWFIPALAINILFLIVYGLYQVINLKIYFFLKID